MHSTIYPKTEYATLTSPTVQTSRIKRWRVGAIGLSEILLGKTGYNSQFDYKNLFVGEYGNVQDLRKKMSE